MSFRHISVGKLFILRWTAFETGDAAHVLSLLERAKLQAGEKLVYFGITPDGVDAPGEQVRKEIVGMIERILKTCDVAYLVLEARGFQGSMVRSALSAMTLIVGRRKDVVVTDTFEEALLKASALASFDRNRVLDTLRVNKFL